MILMVGPTYAIDISKNSENNNKNCAVCLNLLENPELIERLPCDHEFHHGCITPWIEQEYNCPTCRKSLPGPEDIYKKHRRTMAAAQEVVADFPNRLDQLSSSSAFAAVLGALERGDRDSALMLLTRAEQLQEEKRRRSIKIFQATTGVICFVGMITAIRWVWDLNTN